MASDEKRILLVEDEKTIRDAVAAYLERENYIVRGVGDGQSALEEFEKHSFDLIILDLMLPKLSGERVCRAIRETSNVPIIMLTAKGEVEDRIIGLELGADDYLVKPFSFVVLEARLRALVRRGAPERPAAFTAGDLVVDPAAREVPRGDTRITVTAREYAVLEFLVRNRGQVVSKAQILRAVWDAAYDGDDNIVEVYVGYLRRKIDAPFGARAIETVRGQGYRLVDSTAAR